MKKLWYRIIVLTLGLFLYGNFFTCISCKKNGTVQEPYSRQAYIIQLSTDPAPVLPQNYDDLLRYHFFGICWNGIVGDNLKFAKQMGYLYVMYQTNMENSSLAKDFFFYLESPDYQVYNTLGVDRSVVIGKTYSAAQINTYKTYFALRDTAAAFPDNMATGWPRTGSFSVEPDWHQQKVIDYFISKVMIYAHSKEKADRNFLFGGLTWDVPNLTGDFWADGKQVGLARWTGKDSSAQISGIKHDYRTYSEGKAAYFAGIKQAGRTEFPGKTLMYIYEPYNYYDWIKSIEKFDISFQTKFFDNAFITQESGKTAWSTGTEFVDDNRIFNSGLITKDHVGSTTPDNHDLTTNLTIASKAAINGAWFNWYGRFSGSGDELPMSNIYDVPNWLQLIRVVANWDNLNGIQISNRNYNGKAYTSTNSRMDENIIYSRQPKTQKLFAVFLNDSGEITLNPGEKVTSVKRVNGFFIETADGSNDLLVEGNKVKYRTK